MEGKLKSNYSRMIVYGVLLGDLVILNLLLFITYSISNGFLSSEVSYLQFHLIMSICYLVSGAKDRVVLYHRKARAYQIMANELKVPHVVVSSLYMVVQAVLVVGFVLSGYHWWCLGISLILLSIVYVGFMKKFFYLHKT